jgi:hypothetical protein
MIKLSPKTGKCLTSLVLTLFIFSAFVISGFTVAGFDARPNSATDPTSPHKAGDFQSPSPNPDSEEPGTSNSVYTPSFRLTNVIKNGDFEINPTKSVAAFWESFNNGQAQFGWYQEQWEQAVHSGQSSQLLEINLVDNYRKNRIIAIYQTVEVVPNASYSLTIHALMRSDAPIERRNKGEYAMQWGIDYRGAGQHNSVQEWVTMPLSEQLRIGSNGMHTHDDDYLFFQRIFTNAIRTDNTNKLTLFIRGLKIEPTGTEVDFNIDDVSLIGPYFPSPKDDTPPTKTGAPIALPAALPASADNSLPDAGATLPRDISSGALALGGLALIVLGAGAANSLLQKSKNVNKIGQN